jgi:aspartokinase
MLPKVKQKNKKATIESISIAIKRHVSNLNNEIMSGKLREVISNSQITVRDNVVHMTAERTQANMVKIQEASKKIKWDKDEICLINQGAGEITVIVDKKHMVLLEGEIKKNLALLTVKESDYEVKGIDVPGLYAYFISNLSKKFVNILEIISTSSQVSFLIEEKDLTKAYEILKGCVDFCRN